MSKKRNSSQDAETSIAGRRAPIYGSACIVIAMLGILMPLIFRDLGAAADIYARYMIPPICVLLSVFAVLHKERTIFAILGILLVSFYTILHLIA